MSRAAALGAPLEELLERAAGGLQRLAAADRAGIWLKPAWPARTLPGTVVESGGARIAAGLRRLDDVLPLLAAAEAGRETVLLVSGKKPSVPFVGPLAGMRAALLMPLWIGARPLGLALAAWAHPIVSPETEPLERLAGELSLIVARQQAEERAGHDRRQAAELARLSAMLASAVPAPEALREIASAAQWFIGAVFVAVARASRSLEIQVCEPATVAIRNTLAGEEIEHAGRAALAESRAVEATLPARHGVTPGSQHGAPLRIVAHPLEIPRGDAGLLVVGWAAAEGMSGGAATVEPFVPLAAAAWARAAGDGEDDAPDAPQTEAVLGALLDSLDCGVLLFGPEGNLCAFNEQFARILRVEPARVAELGTFERLVARLAPQFADPKPIAERWRERFAGGEASWDELVLLRPEYRVLERFGRPVSDRSGRRLGWLEIYRDISNQRLTENRLLHTDRMAAIGQLVSGVAHELNNPLTSIVGYAQLLLSRRPGPVRSSDLGPILAEAERASRIAKNLLLFARGGRLERSQVDLNEVVERTLLLRNYELRRKEIRVDLDLDRRLPPALADTLQLQQVLLNLIINAEQAIQQGRGRGEIAVRTRRTETGRVALEVADDGPGIAPEDLERVFDPFFTTKPPGVGTGLGLSIVHSIVHEHGGEVLVESRPGAGATFTAELPAAVPGGALAKVRSRVTPASLPVAPRPAAVERRRVRILVVEDEPTVARLIADVFGEDGYAVDTVLDSREGLELARRNGYSLVICDLRMPHLDGRALYGALREHDPAFERRFMFVTGDTLAPHTMEFLEASGVPFLAKPFRVEELKGVVYAILATAGGAPTGDAGRVARRAAKKG